MLNTCKKGKALARAKGSLPKHYSRHLDLRMKEEENQSPGHLLKLFSSFL